MTIDQPAERLRWSRAHRFTLSARGRDAELAYREGIVSSRLQPGRASFDAARATWAARYAVQADDGVYLCELAADGATLSQLLTAVTVSGQTRQDVVAALNRLDDVGMFEARQLIG